MLDFLQGLADLFFGISLPEDAAVNAHLVDTLFNWVLVISIVGFIGLMGVMTFFIVKYHRSQNEKSAYIPHNAAAETVWTVVPLIIFLAIGIFGLFEYFKMNKVPENAYKINVTGKQWAWTFTYAKKGDEGKIISFDKNDIMYVPVNQPILLEMTATDVLHSFYVPSFRIKKDTVPGMNSYLTFTATKEGDFTIFCTEFCGTSHSRMRGVVRVVSQERFNKWINREFSEASITDPVELGYRVYSKNCATCHSTGSNRVIGPGFQGLYGKERSFESGAGVTANEEYIKESILYPAKKIVKGYPNKMNAFAGILSDEDINHVIAYIKTLK